MKEGPWHKARHSAATSWRACVPGVLGTFIELYGCEFLLLIFKLFRLWLRHTRHMQRPSCPSLPSGRRLSSGTARGERRAQQHVAESALLPLNPSATLLYASNVVFHPLPELDYAHLAHGIV